MNIRHTSSSAHQITRSPSYPTWIDTDIGDDIDDAFALALATRLPQLQLLGVSTVGGPVEQRAALARHFLALGGHPNVPVIAGSSTTLTGQPGSAKFHAWPDCGDGSAGLEESARRHDPGDVPPGRLYGGDTLLIIALGPLTNIALALRADPTLAQRARLVMMGGKLGFSYPDWNLRCDPPAARVVLNSGMPVTMVGMHLTLRTKLSPARTQRLFARQHDPLATALARNVFVWRTWKRRMPYLHDVLAVAIAADPILATFEQRRVSIGPWGFSRAERRGPPNALVATDFDRSRYETLLDISLFGSVSHQEGRMSPLARLA
jgi:inosine-uridine nucleoside N-ribohydrolase